MECTSVESQKDSIKLLAVRGMCIHPLDLNDDTEQVRVPNSAIHSHLDTPFHM